MGQWHFPEIVGDSTPDPRGGHSILKLDSGKILMYGGADHQAKPFADLWTLDFGMEQSRWTCIETPNERPTGLSGASLTLIGDKVYLFGGQEPQTGRVHDELWELDTQKLEWTMVKVAGKPSARHSHSATVLNENSLLIFGGSGNHGDLLNDMWVFKTEDSNWYRLDVTEGRQPMPREMMISQMTSPTSMLMYGGRGPSERVLCDAAIFDAKMMQWRNVTYTAFQRCAHAGSLVNRSHIQNGVPNSDANIGKKCLLVYGGFTGEVVEGDILEMDVETLDTKLVSPGPHGNEEKKIPEPRFAHAAMNVPDDEMDGEGLLIFGGVNAEHPMSDVAVWRQ